MFSENSSNGRIAPGEAAAPRRLIWLCADDYGISTGVNTAIRDLIMRGRINATSVMVVAPSFHRSEAISLAMLNTSTRRAAIGLHLTLTAPFRPLSAAFTPLQNGAFLPLDTLLIRSLLRQLNRNALRAEATAQLNAFIAAFGRPPDFIDGHQHVQLFPQVRDAVMDAVKQIAPEAWLRQCGRRLPIHLRFRDRKGLLLDLLSIGFRRRARTAGLRTNPAFAGTYDFAPEADFARIFPQFLDRLPDGGVVMCHPGVVDDELRRLDPLTTLREHEYAYFTDESFSALLAARGIALA